MKALVLAGGAGTRLRPFSYSTPKQLVPVANKPVLFHCLETLRAAGIDEVGIIVSGSGAAVRTAVGDGARFGLDITYIPQEEPRGLAQCVTLAQPFLKDDDFVMYLGDNVFVGGIKESLQAFRENGAVAELVVSKVADPSAYGVVEVDPEGRVTGLQEKPVRPASDLAVTGVYFFTPLIHEAVAGIRPSWRNEWEITDAIQWLVTHGHLVRAHAFTGYWKDTGTVPDLLECNRVLLEDIVPSNEGVVDNVTEIVGPVVIGPGARVERSRIVGPAIIGAGCTVEDSYIGPHTSIGSGVRLGNAGVEASILMDRASVHDVRSIEASLIGRSVDVRPSTVPATAHRLVVGDDSKVEVPA
ncbi:MULTISPECIES: glucose-1-phosphate thymidylyltransferase [unclassified Streptomyces]